MEVRTKSEECKLTSRVCDGSCSPLAIGLFMLGLVVEFDCVVDMIARSS